MPREKKHLINDLPHIYELEDLMAFCKSHEKLYIYGRAFNQEYLLKYLDMCGIRVEGYVVSFIKGEQPPFLYREMPVVLADDVMDKPGVGLILGLADKYYGEVIPHLREKGFTKYFALTEYDKRAIACQMFPREKRDMTFEVSLVDHCNLSCQMCDHYSQLSEPWFLDVEQFSRDMHEMGRIYDHEIGAISLLGGEPTLHPRIIDIIKIVRREFPTSELIVLTNGVKLLSMEHMEDGNFWQVCKDYDVHITVTVYPIKLDYIAIEEKAKEYGIKLAMSSNIHAKELTKIDKISDKHTMNLTGSVPKFYSIHCLYFNKFNVVKDGRYYMCPIQAHSDIFNKAFGQHLELLPEDSLELTKVKDWHELAEFGASWVPFCRYCDLPHWHHASVWKASSKQMDEYV